MTTANKNTFSMGVELRFSDLDAYGHVNNAVIFSLMETARTKALMKEFLEHTENGITFLVVHASCDYKLPILLSDTVIIEMTLHSKGKTSFEIHYHIHNGSDKHFATAKTVMVTFDTKKGKPIKIPENILTVFTL